MTSKITDFIFSKVFNLELTSLTIKLPFVECALAPTGLYPAHTFYYT